MIPVKITATGDLVRAKSYEGFAKEELRKLKRRMSFSEGVNEDSSTVRPFPDVVVECWSSFSFDLIAIHVDQFEEFGSTTLGKKSRLRKVVREEKECLCLPHFAIGKVLEVYQEHPEIDPDEFLLDGRFVYTVEVCSGDVYLKYSGMFSTGWGVYYVGQFVIVTVGEKMSSWGDQLKCSKVCLTKSPRFDVLSICSIYVPGFMNRWMKNLLEETIYDDY